MQKIFFIAIALLQMGIFAQDSKAQTRKEKAAERKEKVNQLIKQEEEGALVFQKQSDFGFKFNTDGFSMFYEHGKYKTISKTNLWWVEMGERKDRHQVKTSPDLNQLLGGFVLVGNSYAFGKQNNFYYLKVGVGSQKLIGGKGSKNGVAVSAIYGGGLSLAMLKPYYVQVLDINTNQLVDTKYNNSNDSLFLSRSLIAGPSSFGKGYGEMKYVPGAHIRTSLRFDYGQDRVTVSALEVGLNAEYYSQKMPIMVHGNESAFYLNAYIAIVFGRRK